MANLGGLLIAAGTATTNPNPNNLILPTTVVAGTDVFTSSVAHGYVTGNKVRLGASAGGALPAGISATTDYFLRVISATTFTLHLTEAAAIANAVIVDATDTGTAVFGVNPLLMFPQTPLATKTQQTPSAVWTTLTTAGTYSKAIRPRNSFNSSVNTPILLNFIPSAGLAATYTATVWAYNDTHARRALTNPWSTPITSGTFNFTGNQLVELANDGSLLWYVQLSSISSGSVAVYFDNGVAEAF
jgi:hypothetical protein